MASQGRLHNGDQIASFEAAYAQRLGATGAVAVASGRAGLVFLLESLNLPKGAEILCPAFGYPVVPYVVKQLGYKLRFVDCELDSLGMDPEKLAEAMTVDTRAVIVAHLYGVPCEIEKIKSITSTHGAHLIEDCAHVFSATVGGKALGTFGTAAYFSLETSKCVNTMGGGVVLSNDSALLKRIRDRAAQEKPPGLKWLWRRLTRTTFEAVATSPMIFNLLVYPALRIAGAKDSALASGYDADGLTIQGKMGRYTNYQATLGCDEILRATAQTAQRRRNAQRLKERIEDLIPCQSTASAAAESDFMLFTVRATDGQRLVRGLLQQGVDAKYHYMRDCTGLAEDNEPCPCAALADQQVVHLPAHAELTDQQIDIVAAAVRKTLCITNEHIDIN